MKTQDKTIAARVPLDLRSDLEEVVRRRRALGERRLDGEPIDLSTVIRKVLREYADHALGRGSDPFELSNPDDPINAILDNGQPGAMRSHPTPTERAAALAVAPRAGSQRRRALEQFELAGQRGLTADEVVVRLAPAPHNGTARRVTDLLQGGFITERVELVRSVETRADDPAFAVTTRTTRAGAQATVYVITSDGRAALVRKREEESQR